MPSKRAVPLLSRASDTLFDKFGELGLEDREPISGLLLPHAAAPVTERQGGRD